MTPPAAWDTVSGRQRCHINKCHFYNSVHRRETGRSYLRTKSEAGKPAKLLPEGGNWDLVTVVDCCPVRVIVRGPEKLHHACMAFAEGQQVKVKEGQAQGIIARKLAFFEDMYVVLLDGSQTPARKLAHESELELLVSADKFMTV